MIYHGIMVSYTAGGDQFPPRVKNFNTFLKSIALACPTTKTGSWCRYLIIEPINISKFSTKHPST
jgi:hypothetical protein